MMRKWLSLNHLPFSMHSFTYSNAKMPQIQFFRSQTSFNPKFRQSVIVTQYIFLSIFCPFSKVIKRSSWISMGYSCLSNVGGRPVCYVFNGIVSTESTCRFLKNNLYYNSICSHFIIVSITFTDILSRYCTLGLISSLTLVLQ